MPEIDIDLFQVLTLAGLAILLILVLALTSAVSKLSKAVKAEMPGAAAASSETATEMPSAAEEESAEAGLDSGFAAASGTVAATGAVSSSEESIAASVEPETQDTTTSQWYERSTEDETISTSAAGPTAEEPAEVASELVAEPAAEPVAGVEAEPVAGVEAEPVIAAAATPAAVEELPEEQPFERGGRWWFKRGDELLVYEEQTGQWAAAPDGAFEKAAGAGTEYQRAAQSTATQTTTAASDVAQTETDPIEDTGTLGPISDETATAWRTDETVGEDSASEPETSTAETSMWGLEETSPPLATEDAFATTSESAGVEGESATFWKCASCGAVNGSTASTCRMCFAKRP